MIPAKFKNYDVYNNDGTVRYTRHQDGSVLLPSFIFLDTGEEVLQAFYDILGLTAPTRPTTPDPDTHFDDQTQPQGYDALQVSEDGFIRLGDRVLTKNGVETLVGFLESWASAATNTTRADNTDWTGKIYLPTGQEVSDYVEAWVVGGTLPIADTDTPTAPNILSVKQVYYSTSVRVTWDVAEDAGYGVNQYRVYVDGAVLAVTDDDVTQATVDTGSLGEKLIEVEAVDASGNVGPRNQASLILRSLATADVLCPPRDPVAPPPDDDDCCAGTTYFRTHTGDAPAGTSQPNLLPSPVNSKDSVVEQWDDVVRAWYTSDGVSWTKQIEFAFGGSGTGTGGNTTHLSVRAGNIPVPYPIMSVVPSDSLSEDGDVLIQKFDDAVAYGKRTSPGTWETVFVVSIVPDVTIDLNTWASEEAGNVPVPYTTATGTLPDDTASDVGDLLVQKFDDAVAYSVKIGSNNWQVVFIWSGGTFPAQAIFEKVATKALRNNGIKIHGFRSLVGENQVIYRWDDVAGQWDIDDFETTLAAADMALITNHEPYQKVHNTDINRSFYWATDAPLGPDWMEWR